VRRRLTQREIAWHEAAHGVACFFYPLAGRRARLTIRGAVLSDYNMGRHRENRAGGVCFPPRTLPSIRNGVVVDAEQLRHELLMILAGGAADFLRSGVEPSRPLSKRAEARARRNLAHLDGSEDTVRALTLLHEARPFDRRAHAGLDVEAAAWAHHARVEAELEALRREALAFVAARWPHVSAVAEALVRAGTLEGDAVVEIIEAVEARLREGPPALGWGAS
jgi:hypothetical protein